MRQGGGKTLLFWERSRGQACPANQVNGRRGKPLRSHSRQQHDRAYPPRTPSVAPAVRFDNPGRPYLHGPVQGDILFRTTGTAVHHSGRGSCVLLAWFLDENTPVATPVQRVGLQGGWHEDNPCFWWAPDRSAMLRMTLIVQMAGPSSRPDRPSTISGG